MYIISAEGETVKKSFVSTLSFHGHFTWQFRVYPTRDEDECGGVGCWSIGSGEVDDTEAGDFQV